MNKKSTAIAASALGVGAASLMYALNVFQIKRNISRQKYKTLYYLQEKEKLSCDALFIGDSITWLFKLEESFPDKSCINRGISGDKTTDILARCEHSFKNISAKKIFLLAGINDLNQPDCEAREVLDNLYRIIDIAKKYNSQAEIYVESVYPVNNSDNNKRHDRCREKILKVNSELLKNAEEKGYTYIDMYSVLENGNGGLVESFTYDGLHPSKEGYKVIAQEIRKYL